MNISDQSSSILSQKLKHSDYSSLSETGTLKDLDGSDNDGSYCITSSESESNTVANKVSDNFNFIKKSLYRCKVCDAEVKPTNLRHHWTIHCRTEYCKGCDRKYTKKGLKQHKCETSTFCFRCQKKIGSRSKLEAHFRKHDLVDKRQTPLPITQWKTFTCEICNKTLQMRAYRQHMKGHNESMTCEICNKQIVKRYIETHKNTCLGYCQICDKYIQGIDKYRSHIENHKNDFGCIKCDLKFPYLIHMAYHYSDVHCQIEKPFYQCFLCDKKVKALPAHLRIHSKNAVECEICKKTLPNHSAYKEHIRYHKQLIEKGVHREIIPKIEQGIKEVKKCTQCDQKYKTLSELYRHFDTHIKLPGISCPQCDEEFHQLHDLTMHISQKHFHTKNGGELKCFQCTKVVPDLFRHSRIHEPPRFECEACEIPFYSTRKLHKHYNLVHSRRLIDLTPLQKIKIVYKNKYELDKKRLMKFKHSCLLNKKVSKSVNCLLCKQIVYHPNYATWMHHINYKCKARQKKMLKKCSICLKLCFGDSKSKRQHMTDHTNSFSDYTVLISQHTCPLCSQAFLSHIRLKAHLLRCHSLNRVSSRTCVNCRISANLND